MSHTSELSPGAQQRLQQAAKQVSQLWWVPLLTGVVSVVLGLTILATDWTVHALVVVTGILFIARGLALAFSPAYASGSSGEQVVAGVLGILAGIAMVAWPGPTLLVLAFFVGIWLAVSGGFHIVESIARRHDMPYWGFTLALGVVELLLGIWAMRRPEVTLSLIIAVLGLWAIITGIIYCVLAFEVRNVGKELAEAASSGALDAAETTDRLDRLARLHAHGQLTTEEYEQLKAALLGTTVPAQRASTAGTSTAESTDQPVPTATLDLGKPPERYG
jgi:uncharacterized membrane protein HdeD (DUF308 family)